MEVPVRTNHIQIRRIVAGILILSACLLCACSAQNRKEQKLRNEGIALMEDGDYTGAITVFDDALSQRSGDKLSKIDIDILRYRAEAEWKIDDYSAAADTYRLLIEYDDGRDEDKNMRIICLVKSGGDLDEALSLYNDADSKPDRSGHKEAMYALGDALTTAADDSEYDQSYLDAAMTIYNQAMQRDEYISAELYNRIGLIYYKQENYKAALDEFTAGIAWADDEAKKSKDEESLEITTSDSYKALKFNEASCYEYLTDYKKALELFKEYEAQYGTDDKSTHEIDFLETR